jgi:predicted acyl esterase
MNHAHHRLLLAIVAGLLFALSVEPGAADSFARPDAKHTVRIEKSVFVPMRDGVRLSTDLYFPEKIEGPLPVVLIRTPDVIP